MSISIKSCWTDRTLYESGRFGGWDKVKIRRPGLGPNSQERFQHADVVPGIPYHRSQLAPFTLRPRPQTVAINAAHDTSNHFPLCLFEVGLFGGRGCIFGAACGAFPETTM
jgi:hypothetical protein